MTAADRAPAVPPRHEPRGQPAAPSLLRDWAPPVLWLIIAEKLRVDAWAMTARDRFAMMTLADLATFLAFLAMTRLVIRRAGGVSGLERLSIGAQLDCALSVYPRLFAVCMAAYFGAGWIAWKGGFETLGRIAPHLAHGFDGVAFDQRLAAGRAWSAVVAVLALLLTVERGAGRPATFAALADQLRRRWLPLLGGVVVVTLLAVPLAEAQALARAGVRAFFAGVAPPSVKVAVFMLFVVGFALLRLGMTVAILCLALRQSYRRGD